MLVKVQYYSDMYKVSTSFKIVQLRLIIVLKKLLQMDIHLIYNYGIQLVNKDIKQLFIVFLNFQKLHVLYLILQVKNHLMILIIG